MVFRVTKGSEIWMCLVCARVFWREPTVPGEFHCTQTHKGKHSGSDSNCWCLLRREAKGKPKPLLWEIDQIGCKAPMFDHPPDWVFRKIPCGGVKRETKGNKPFDVIDMYTSSFFLLGEGPNPPKKKTDDPVLSASNPTREAGPPWMSGPWCFWLT